MDITTDSNIFGVSIFDPASAWRFARLSSEANAAWSISSRVSANVSHSKPYASTSCSSVFIIQSTSKTETSLNLFEAMSRVNESIHDFYRSDYILGRVVPCWFLPDFKGEDKKLKDISFQRIYCRK